MNDIAEINHKIKMIKKIENDSLRFDESHAKLNPFEQFLEWFNELLDSNLADPPAMVVASVDENNFPDTRVVLLKELALNQFIFFTNYTSNKAKQFAKSSVVALNFHWPQFNRQVRIRGKISKVSREKSEKYFNSRPHEAQLAAYASHQSSVVSGKEEIEKKT